MLTTTFTNFDQAANGQIVTHCANGYNGILQFVFSRNPYGSHNLVVVEDGQAVSHGNRAAIYLANWVSKRAYRRLVRFLSKREAGRAFLRTVVAVES